MKIKWYSIVYPSLILLCAIVYAQNYGMLPINDFTQSIRTSFVLPLVFVISAYGFYKLFCCLDESQQ
jgi:hypothetical protein